jgi:thioesterase domain-containing protein
MRLFICDKKRAESMLADANAQIFRFVLKGAETVVPLVQREQGVPIYLAHSIGGDVGSYSALARSMADRFSIFGIQATKDVINGNVTWTIPKLAAHYVDKLHHFQPTGPIILGGWSAGAVIALEMAQQLRTKGRRVSGLIVFDGILKNTGGGLHPWDPRYQLKLICNLPRWIRDDYLRGRDRRSLWSLARRSRMKHSVDGFMNMSGWTQSAANFSRTLFDAIESYVPKTYDGNILAYVAKTEPLTHLFQVAAMWGKICDRVEIAEVPGTHLNLMREPLVSDIAVHLSRRLLVLNEKNGYARDVT